jgi:hypothetical protein
MVLPVLVVLAALAGCGKTDRPAEVKKDRVEIVPDRDKGEQPPKAKDRSPDKEKVKDGKKTEKPEVVKLPPPPKEVPPPAALVAEIDKAGAGVKLVKLNFKAQGQDMTLDAPEGTEVRDDPLRGLEIQRGTKFILKVFRGRRELLNRKADDKGGKPEVDVTNLYLTRNARGSFVFMEVLKVGYQDFTVCSEPLVAGRPVEHTRADCLLMMKCARTLALKVPLPKDPRKALEALGGTMSEKDGKDGKVRVIRLYSSKATDTTLALLAHFPDLEDLNTDSDTTDFGLQYLTGLKKLRVLNLSGTGVSDAGLVYLAALKSLRDLDLSDTGVTDKGAQLLRKALPKTNIKHSSKD